MFGFVVFSMSFPNAIPHFESYINKVEHKYNTRDNLSMLHPPKVRTEAAKIHLCFKALLVSTDSQLTYKH